MDHGVLAEKDLACKDALTRSCMHVAGPYKMCCMDGRVRESRGTEAEIAEGRYPFSNMTRVKCQG